MMMTKHTLSKIPVLFFILLWIPSCAHVISSDMRKAVNKNLLFSTVLQNPQAYKGESVIWGGIIIETFNRKDGTVIKVLETPVGTYERPEDEEKSRGRFIARTSKYLDPEIYRKGKKITLAGKIVGKEIYPLGEIQYTYPIVLIKEIYLWKDRTTMYRDRYPADLWYPWHYYSWYPYYYHGYPWYPHPYFW